ncbi:D-lactate dehydrogenase [Oceanobacillus iheyensis HTE831]|uniref:D-lactate dehydrogenase (cytochrome) n=1 Tax=Oceanobacillus iheyensis (strain DSM 14371 / CIP 107618 / JCM 11309 / KCTC 3954 / HTE831) TaxID=221109 RepID=Q8ERP2_OCEIH|nr:FAD-linked oxidase C-terminal domain-containing protein [Oceanobacillus iheyensis]BAC13215.1 D-lactate dehydrogenase [Oceanobacillus iheyensis HTE831]
MYVEQLIEKLGMDNVSQKESILIRHGYDESPHKAVEPDVVCFPTSKEDVQAILEIARNNQIPVTPFGTGSGLEGSSIPVKKGISINFEQMDTVLEFSPENMTVTVQPGITRFRLNDYINSAGLYFPVDPGVDATIGGMVATNASGTTAVRYGAMKDQLIDLEVVMADGTIIHTASKAKKSSSGYLITNLFAGSEGTLGIITEVTLKLHPIPEYTIMARCTFETINECATASQQLLLSGIPLKRIELMDAASVAEVNRQNGYKFSVRPSLFFEFAGAKQAVEAEVELAQTILDNLSCEHWSVALDPDEQQELWKARYDLSYSFQSVKGMDEVGADVCVPIKELPELITYARELIDETGLKGGVWGHVGDGNFHTLILFDPLVNGERQLAESVNEALAIRAIEVGGSCTGEHGVGIGKQKYQELEHGNSLPIMQNIKQLFDPTGILNPGKIFMN